MPQPRATAAAGAAGGTVKRRTSARSALRRARAARPDLAEPHRRPRPSGSASGAAASAGRQLRRPLHAGWPRSAG